MVSILNLKDVLLIDVIFKLVIKSALPKIIPPLASSHTLNVRHVCEKFKINSKVNANEQIELEPVIQ